MKACLMALGASVALLISSLVLAEPQKDSAGKFQGDSQVYAELARAPEKARTKRNPLEKDADVVAAGRNLFEQHCAECHGEMAEGSKKAPSLRANEVQGASPGALFWLLTNGVVRRGMPVWSKLPEPQRWQLVSYLKSLGPSNGSQEQKKPNEKP